MRRHSLPLLLSAAAVVAGCTGTPSSTGSPTPGPALLAGTAEELAAQARGVAARLDAGDDCGAVDELESLRAQLDARRQAGELPDEIHAQATAVLDRIAAQVVCTPTDDTTTPTPGDEDDDDEDRGRGRDRAPGQDRQDDDRDGGSEQPSPPPTDRDDGDDGDDTTETETPTETQTTTETPTETATATEAETTADVQAQQGGGGAGTTQNDTSEGTP